MEPATFGPLLEVPDQPEPSGEWAIPPSRRLVIGSPFFAETNLDASGKDGPGRFGEVILKPLRYGCWIESARGSTHSGQFHFFMKVRGPYEPIELLRLAAEADPLFPKIRPDFVICREANEGVKCIRHEIFVEAEDDVQIANIPVLAGKRGLNIASMEMRRIEPGESNQYVTAQFCMRNDARKGAEMMVDVEQNQSDQFVQFKADLLDLMDHDELIRVWEPLQEDQAGARPWWKSNHRRVWR